MHFITKIAVIFLLGLIEYIISYFSLSFIYIYEDKVEFVFPVRFKDNTVSIYFNEIDRVTLKSYARGVPFIIFFKSPSQNWFYPWNSFNCANFKKRKEILKFLHSKGLKIVVKSDEERDLKILK